MISPPRTRVLDDAGPDFAFGYRTENGIPTLFENGFLFGEDNHSVVVLDAFEKNLEHIAGLDFLALLKLAYRNRAFGFISDIHQHFMAADFQNASGNNRSLRKVFEGFVVQAGHGIPGLRGLPQKSRRQLLS